MNSFLTKAKKSLAGMKNRISGMADDKFFRIYQHQLSILLTLMIFLAAGILEADGAAVRPDDGQTLSGLVPAYKVSMDGTELVYVSDPGPVKSALAQKIEETKRQYDMDVSLDQEITFEKKLVSPKRVYLPPDTQNVIRREAKVQCNASAVYANDVRIGTVKNEKEANEFLNRFKSQYVEDGTKPESVTFQEEIKIVPISVPPDQVQDMDTVLAETAKGRETVQEYTVADGDTLTTVAESHDMDLDRLVAENSHVPDPDHLKPGQKLRLSCNRSPLNVVTTEVISQEEAIPFETEVREDESMDRSRTKTLQKGREGRKKMDIRVEKVNGEEKNRAVLSGQVLSEPVKKIIAKGFGKAEQSALSSRRGGGSLFKPTSGRLTSGFGQRWGRLHKGIDLANSVGTPIYAADSGKVIFAGTSRGYGNFIQIDHGSSGLITCYGHLKSFDVSAGEVVRRGQLIAHMGSTGNSTGPHLHFEVRVNNAPQNPIKYLS
jgi:murein DD-endopeptidase MepM/ murein hydrolase activator NlpD